MGSTSVYGCVCVHARMHACTQAHVCLGGRDG